VLTYQFPSSCEIIGLASEKSVLLSSLSLFPSFSSPPHFKTNLTSETQNGTKTATDTPKSDTTPSMKIGLQSSLSAAQVQEMKMASEFNKSELKRLFRRFKKLDLDKSGTLSVSEFLAIPELEHNPLVRRVVATFDADHSGEVDFPEFISALSVFATADGKEKKYKFTFKMYDVDGDGFISNADLFHVLKAMVGNNLNDIQLQQLVDRTILQGDKDKDGKLSYKEFVEMVKETDLEGKLKIEF